MKMVMIEGKFYLDAKTKKELDWGIECCKQEDDDFVIIVDGKEGAGKSKLVRQIGYYCASKCGYKFGLDNIHFTSETYREAAEKNRGKKGWVNILDESRSSLNKRRSMSRQNVQFTNWFSECRDMNQIHILVLPAMHDLDTYIGLWRLNIVLHILKYRKEDEKRDSGFKMVRGTYVSFSPDEMQAYIHKQYRYGKYAYPRRPRSLYQNFSNYEVLEDLEAYKEKKAQERAQKEENEESESKYLNKLRIAVWLLNKKYHNTCKQIGQWTESPERSINQWVNDNEKRMAKGEVIFDLPQPLPYPGEKYGRIRASNEENTGIGEQD